MLLLIIAKTALAILEFPMSIDELRFEQWEESSR
jgi:hypothetical protein